MSILKEIKSQNLGKFVIPRAGKMFMSSIGHKDNALAFCLNKGYFETSSLNSMLEIVESLETYPNIILVGDIQKVQVVGVEYRQRIFFKSLKDMLTICKKFGIDIIFPEDFHIDINCMMNVLSELVYLERYAHSFGETIEEYLTNTLFIQLHYVFKNINMYSDLTDRVEKVLKDKQGYMNRAPFLISSYNIDKKTSSLFLNLDYNDKRLFTCDIPTDKLDITYGYTERVVQKDKKEGVFK